jgi:hypothetical protein
MAIEYREAGNPGEVLAMWHTTRRDLDAHHYHAITTVADLLADSFTRDGSDSIHVIKALAVAAARLNALIAVGADGIDAKDALLILGLAAAELDRRRRTHGN